MDHHDHIEMDGPFPFGWVWAVVAGLATWALAGWFGAPVLGALVLGITSFVVFAVLLGQFWEPPVAGDGHGHGHGHGHDHGRDHGHHH